MAESAKFFEWFGFLEFAVVGGFDFEAISVFSASFGSEVDGFFAGDPGAPGGHAACAITVGASEGEEFFDDFLFFEVVDDVGCSADLGRVSFFSHIVGVFAFKVSGNFTSRKGGLALLTGAEFVVSDEDHLIASFPRKAGHSVGDPWYAEAVAHFVTTARDDFVGEVCWEIEDPFGIFDEGAVWFDDSGGGFTV